MRNYLYFLTFYCLLFFQTDALSQKSQIHPFVSTGMLIGAHTSGQSVYLKNAYSIYSGVSLILPTTLLEPTFFIGLEKFAEETLVPLGIELNAYRNDQKRGSHFSFAGGYAMISSAHSNTYSGAEYHGGPHLGFGYGYTWPLSTNGKALQSSIRLRQQFFKTERYTDGIEIFSEKFSYLLIQFSLRFRI